MSATWLLTALAALVGAQSMHGPMYHFPQWSPDGTSILASTTVGDAEICLLHLDGSLPRMLTDNDANDDMAIWIDGGRQILFMSDRRGRSEPFVMNADGTNQQPTDLQPPKPSSPDGRTRLIESTADGRGVIVLVEGSRSRTITSGPHAEQASFSANGRWIAYEQRSPGRPNDIQRSNIVIANADGSLPKVVASGTDPSWAPREAIVVFKTFDAETGALWISTIRADGTGFTRLARGVHPHWSPDGTRIAFMKDGADGRTDIWFINADGTGSTCVTCPPRR